MAAPVFLSSCSWNCWLYMFLVVWLIPDLGGLVITLFGLNAFDAGRSFAGGSSLTWYDDKGTLYLDWLMLMFSLAWSSYFRKFEVDEKGLDCLIWRDWSIIDDTGRKSSLVKFGLTLSFVQDICFCGSSLSLWLWFCISTPFLEWSTSFSGDLISIGFIFPEIDLSAFAWDICFALMKAWSGDSWFLTLLGVIMKFSLCVCSQNGFVSGTQLRLMSVVFLNLGELSSTGASWSSRLNSLAGEVLPKPSPNVYLKFYPVAPLILYILELLALRLCVGDWIRIMFASSFIDLSDDLLADLLNLRSEIWLVVYFESMLSFLIFAIWYVSSKASKHFRVPVRPPAF